MSAPGRRLALTCAGLLAAAGALAGASGLTWFAADVPAPGRAPVRVAVAGGDVLAGLDAVALLALAGVAAAVALVGPARRVLGTVLVLVAGWLAVALAGAVATPSGADLAAFPGAPAGAGVPADVTTTAAPVLAGAGVLALAIAGAVLALREPRLARFGARYAAPRARPAPGREPAGDPGRDPEREPDPDPDRDPDRAAWEALDAGRDPTDPGADGGADPGGGHGERAV
ncbi:MAG: Trp biosynthesis-associated membrane protein [Pseudonocardia sp.]